MRVLWRRRGSRSQHSARVVKHATHQQNALRGPSTSRFLPHHHYFPELCTSIADGSNPPFDGLSSQTRLSTTAMTILQMTSSQGSLDFLWQYGPDSFAIQISAL